MLRAVHDVSSDPIELNGPTAARYRGKAFQTPPPFFELLRPHEMHRGIWAIHPSNERKI
jgi:hypothetical protein